MPALYSEGPSFISQPGDLLSWGFQWFFSVSLGKC